MTTRDNDDDHNEKIIRSLLKLPPNRRCINCDSIGPLYAVTNFSIFVCSMCAGIHREFSHRVKSVSIATFTSEEVSALQRGGNEVAKEIFFKEWDVESRFNSKSSNMQRLRNLIKQVYVEKRYTGEKNVVDRPSNVKIVDIGSARTTEMDAYVSHYMERCRSIESDGDRTPRSDYGERTPRLFDYSERKSPKYGQQSKRRDNYKKISARFEVVDDRYHRSGSTGSLEDTCFPEMLALQEAKRSQIRNNKEVDSPRPRGIRSLREVLDKIPSLRVTNPLKGNEDKDSDSPANKQQVKTPPIGKKLGKPMEVKKLNSLENKRTPPILQKPIDHADAKPAPNAQQLSISIGASSESAASPTDNNWATFDCNDQENQLVVASSNKKVTNVVSPQLPVPEIRSTETDTSVASLMLLDVDTSVPLSPISTISTAMTPSNMSTTSPFHHGSSSAWEAAPLDVPSIGYVTESQSSHLEQKSNTTKELPQDLFTTTYSPVPIPCLGWQPIQAHGMTYPLSAVQAFSQPIASRNPFDLNDQTNALQSQGMSSMAGARSNGLPYVVVPSHSLHASEISPWQPIPNKLPSERYGEVGAFGNNGATLSILHSNHQLNGGVSTITQFQRTNSSLGGNPFA